MLFTGLNYQGFKDDGVPNSGGVVKFFKPGTSTPKEVFSDSDLTTSAGTSVTLDSQGRATIFLSGEYKVREEDSNGNLIDETDGVGATSGVGVNSGAGNAVSNPSFEVPGNTSSDASDWTFTAINDGTIERFGTDNRHGTWCLRCESTGNGGGQADTDVFFAVDPSETYEISFAIRSSVADIRNIVQIRYFDENKNSLSDISVYDENTNNPTAWEVRRALDTPPSNARFAKIRIIGADQSDTTPGVVKFDNISVVPRGGAFLNTIEAISSDYTVPLTDLGKVLSVTGTRTITLPVAATATVGFPIVVKNDGSSNVTIDGDSSETINGSSTIGLGPGESITLVSDGSNWIGLRGDSEVFSSVKVVTSAETLSASDVGTVVSLEKTGTGAFDVTLPSASISTHGFPISFVNNGSSIVNVKPSGSDKINTGFSNEIAPQGSAILTTDGSNWFGPVSNPGVGDSIDQTGNISFDTWAGTNAEGVQLLVEVRAETDGSNVSKITLSVDESGGTTEDYRLLVQQTPPTLVKTAINGTPPLVITLPPNTNFRINNDDDPNGTNSIEMVREYPVR